jgi:hypothetical protein
VRRISVIALLAIGILVVAGASSAVALQRFVTPSRNIACLGDRTELRCDILQ